MPIYEYQCTECQHKLEILQRMTDDRLTTCPSCQKETLIKLVSAAGFQLKGTGWYETDFKNKGKKPESKSSESSSSEKKSSDSAAASSSSKTESSGSSTKTASD